MVKKAHINSALLKKNRGAHVMKKKRLYTVLSVVFLLGFLSGCGMNNNKMNDTEDVNYRPVRFDQNNTDTFDGTDPNMNPARENIDNRGGNRDLLNNVQQNDRLYNENRDDQLPGTGGTMRGQ